MSDKILSMFVAFLFGMLTMLLWVDAHAQSSQMLTYDLRIAQWNVSTCKSNWEFYHVRHNPPLNPPGDQYYWPKTMSRDDLQAACVQWAIKIYKRKVDTEEALIEGMSKACCPNVKQAPSQSPRYPGERKEFKNVQSEQEKMIEMFAAGLK